MNTLDTSPHEGSASAPAPRSLVAISMPSTGASAVLGTAVFLAAVVLMARGGGDVLHAPTVWLFGVGLILLPMAGLWWVLGHVVPWVVGRRRRADVAPAGLALREGALWCFWLGWVVLILFQPVYSFSDGGLAAPWVKVSVVVLVVAGVVGRGLRLEEGEYLSAGLGYRRGTLGKVVFLLSSTLLGVLTVACLFVLILSIGSGFNSPVPVL